MFNPEEESVYNLVKPDPVQAKKAPRYKSKFPGNSEPTASTFGLAQVQYI